MLTAKEGVAPVEPNVDAVDAELVAGLRRGEGAAFDATYARYRVRIHGFLVRLAGNRHLADDLYQETFVRLARHATRLEPGTDLAAWLYTVARNLHRNHCRFLFLDGERLRALHLGSSRPSPETPEFRAAAAQSLARLDAALLALPAAHREVLLLVGVEGLEPAQAAQVLGLRPEALRKRLERARTALALRLASDPSGVRP